MSGTGKEGKTPAGHSCALPFPVPILSVQGLPQGCLGRGCISAQRARWAEEAVFPLVLVVWVRACEVGTLGHRLQNRPPASIRLLCDVLGRNETHQPFCSHWLLNTFASTAVLAISFKSVSWAGNVKVIAGKPRLL